MEIVYQFIQGISSSLFTSLLYIPAAIGFYIALRCLRFPDLTVEGSFIFGQSIIAFFIVNDLSPLWGMLLAILGGAFLGCFTGWQHRYLKIPSFVCGIITTFFITTFNFKLLHWADKTIVPQGGQPNTPSSIQLTNSGIFQRYYDLDFSLRSFWGELRIYELLLLVVICTVTILVIYFCLKSKTGLRIRAFGVHRQAAEIYEHKSHFAIIGGLAFTNAFVSLSGAIFTQANRLAAIEFGATLLIPLLAAVVLGEFVIDYLFPKVSQVIHSFRNRNYDKKPLLSRPWGLTIAPVIGFLIYNLSFIFVAIFVLPQLSNQTVYGVDSHYKYVITAAVIIIVLLFKRNDKTNKPHPEDVI